MFLPKFKLFLVGIVMGIADLIPGISGGTVAFLAGIYEELLLSIQSLQFQSLKKIKWSFLFPLGSGIATAFLSLAHLVYHVLEHPLYRAYLCALFFGLVFASAWQCGQRAKMREKGRWIVFLIGTIIAYLLSGKTLMFNGLLSPLGLILAGSLAAGALLLPGISGSYLLCLLGVYPIAMGALTQPMEGWPILLPLAIGIALGLLCFSHLIHLLLKHFHSFTLSLLTGFMIGGLRSVWPFGEGDFIYTTVIVLFGIAIVFLIDKLSSQKLKKSSSSKD